MSSSIAFLSFSLLAWAWLLQTWLAAGLVLLAIFIANQTPWRWQISLMQFYRWGDLSSLLTVLLLLYLYGFQTSERPVFILLKWLPLLFAPVLLAQLFSSKQKLPLGTLFYSFRNRQTEDSKELDFQLPYAGLTLLSAGAANVQNLSYFVLAIGLFAGILWSVRPNQTPKWAWLLVITVAIMLSHWGQFGLRRLQNILEYKSIQWLGDWQADPFKTQTSLGDLGEMKLSDKIVFRVKTGQPVLLMQASYDRYLGKSWTVSRYTFGDENPVKALKNQPLKQLEILQQFSQHEEVLALPDGTVNITGLEGADLQYSNLGAVKIMDTPDFADYRVFYTGERTDLPNQYDLKVPKQHGDWLMQLSHELKLAELKPQAIAATITGYFQRDFRYSLYLGTESDADLALRDFILKRKVGHCEYFAVASVLLLRQAGIPARLANGYAVEEYDPQQNLYLVRRRHAHAWAIAYLHGRWQTVDSTPSEWLEMENEQASVFQPINDWFSNALFQFKQWQAQAGEKQNTVWLGAALLLACYISWRIYSARRQLIRESKVAKITKEPCTYQGLDSEFYLIEQQFLETQQARANNESIQEWVKRLQMPELIALAKLHYRLRFDPQGIQSEQRKQLQQQVTGWLKKRNDSL
jgi:hypothetical protein